MIQHEKDGVVILPNDQGSGNRKYHLMYKGAHLSNGPSDHAIRICDTFPGWHKGSIMYFRWYPAGFVGTTHYGFPVQIIQKGQQLGSDEWHFIAVAANPDTGKPFGSKNGGLIIGTFNPTHRNRGKSGTVDVYYQVPKSGMFGVETWYSYINSRGYLINPHCYKTVAGAKSDLQDGEEGNLIELEVRPNNRHTTNPKLGICLSDGPNKWKSVFRYKK